jgi:hypothetical protein
MSEIKRINLFAKQKKYLKIEQYFSWFRTAVIILVIGFLTFIGFILISLFQQQQKLKALDLQRKQYLAFLTRNNQVEAKFIFYKNKNTEFNNIMTNDVNFLPYYRVLNESLKFSTSAALLNTLTINKDRNTDFSILVEDYDTAFQFIKYAETDHFLKNFEALTLVEFSSQLNTKTLLTTTLDNQTRLITLSFKGKFRKLNEN